MQLFLVFGVAYVAVFVAGVILSQKIKDYFNGIPAHVRADLSAMETTLLGRIRSAQSTAVAGIKAQVGVPTPVLQTTITAAVSASPPIVGPSQPA